MMKRPMAGKAFDVLKGGLFPAPCFLKEDLDFFEVPLIEPSLTRWAEQPGQVLLLNISAVKYLDAAALHLFERLDFAAKANGSQILFLVSPFQRRIMRLVGLDRVLSTYEPVAGEPISRGRYGGEAPRPERRTYEAAKAQSIVPSGLNLSVLAFL